MQNHPVQLQSLNAILTKSFIITGSTFTILLHYDMDKKDGDADNGFNCPECGQNYKTRSSCTNHYNVEHLGRTFPCRANGCDLVYASGSARSKHEKKQHAEIEKSLTESVPNLPCLLNSCQKLFYSVKMQQIDLQHHEKEVDTSLKAIVQQVVDLFEGKSSHETTTATSMLEKQKCTLLEESKRSRDKRTERKKRRNTGANLLSHKEFESIFAMLRSEQPPNIDISKLTIGSDAYANFKCPDAICDHHVWTATVSSVVRSFRAGSTGCGYCRGLDICPCNSIPTKFPKMAEEFKAAVLAGKNEGIDIDKLAPGSDIKVWWKCLEAECDHHIWYAPPSERTGPNKRGNCIFCVSSVICPCDSFGTYFPLMLQQFLLAQAEGKNPGIDPFTVSFKSGAKFWWKCVIGCEHHLWEARVRDRTTGLEESPESNGCRFCAKKDSCSCNFFGTANPLFFKEFNSACTLGKNSGIDPYKIATNTNIEVWFKCSKHSSCDEHIFEMSMRRRATRNCPYCTNRKICRCMSFAHNFPMLLEDFNRAVSLGKNEGINPFKIGMNGHHDKMWWACPKPKCQKLWYALVSNRCRGTGCPRCRQSRMEEILTLAIQALTLRSEDQKTFPGCRFKDPLRFDKFLQDLLGCVEVDGLQHFESVDFGGGPTDLENQRLRDKIKNDYCRFANMHLLRISYSEHTRIAKHLTDFVQRIQAAEGKTRIEMFCGEEYKELKYVPEKKTEESKETKEPQNTNEAEETKEELSAVDESPEFVTGGGREPMPVESKSERKHKPTQNAK